MVKRLPIVLSVVVALLLGVIATPQAGALPRDADRIPRVTPRTASPQATRLPVGGQTVPLANAEARVNHYNLCLDARQCQGKPENPVDLVVYFHAVDQPWSISVNEACASDIDDIEDRTGLDFAFVVGQFNVPECPTSDRRFGNAIALVGSARVPDESLCFEEQFAGPCPDDRSDNPDTGYSTAICRSATVFNDVIASCSAHLEGREEASDIAKAQALEYESWAQGEYAGRRRWLSGDLNLRRASEPKVPQVYFDIYELTFYANTAFTPSPSRQLDYIWVNKAFHFRIGSPVPYCATDYSDHCFSFGYFGITLT